MIKLWGPEFWLALLALFAVSVASAQAQTICGPYDRAVGVLKQKYNERVTHRGIASLPNGTPGPMIELWSNDETGSFTILSVKPNGTACLFIGGEGWGAEPVGEAL